MVEKQSKPPKKEMKSVIKLLILYQIIELFEITNSDHVQVIHCPEHSKCVENVNVELLKVIKENLLNTTDPCDNFWDYACGSWTAEPYYDHVDNFGAMTNYYADNLIKTLKELNMVTPKENRDIDNLIHQLTSYFLSCLSSNNYYLNMRNYLNQIQEREIFGANFKWEFLHPENVNIWQNFDWLYALASLRKYGFNGVFLQESVSFAWNNSLQHVVQLKIPHTGITFQNKYKILQLLEEFDLIQNSGNWLSLAQELYDFEQELVDLYRKYESSKQDHFITFQDLQTFVPLIDWSQYFKILLNQLIDSETPIEFLGDLQYFQDLTHLLSQKNQKIVGFYTLIRFCNYLLDIRPLIYDRECLLHTNLMFPLGVNYIYNRFIYKTRNEDEKVLQNIFYKLKQQFAKNLQDNKLSLSSQELNYLLDKLQFMQLQIGNLPSKISNINNYYSFVNISKSNFYYNHLEMLKFRTLKQHEAFLKPAQTILNLHNYYVNDDISQLRNAPYFIHQRNKLIVPMLFLQLPFYHHSQHSVLQYSLLGWIIAHELSHAFDAHGLYYDAWGNENLIGLQISKKLSYLSATNCLISSSPTASLNERIADVNGLQLVWQAYSQQFSLAKELPANFSLQELFFINFSQFFCGLLPRAIGHDRDDVRVKVAVANMHEFSEIFHCHKGAKENPSEKCNIWRK